MKLTEEIEQSEGTETSKETRAMVTPYAFQVSDNLLGTPLAKPLKRGFAMLIDLIFVGLLSQMAAFVLAGIAAMTFFKAGNRLQQKKRFNGARIGLRFLTAVLLFVFCLGVFDWFNDDNNQNGSQKSFSEVAFLAANTLKYNNYLNSIESGECLSKAQCWSSFEQELIHELNSLELDQDQRNMMLTDWFNVIGDKISEDKKQFLIQKLNADVTVAAESNQGSSSSLPKPVTPNVDGNQNTQYSIVKLIEGLLADLGLGFGWATFYFSITTAWWKGQTLGKKLLGIKVIKLDNMPLNLWESFGRYGGYGAGIATGLLGFLQIYWDPNRQAIQDKISATLVIDLRKQKSKQ